jgi:Flp pilus assembly protein TadD
VLEATPSDDDLHLQIGHLEKMRGDFGAAATHYKRAVELNPGNTDALREHEALSSLVERSRHADTAP